MVILTSCKDTIFYKPKICDSTIYNYRDSVLFDIKDSVRIIDKEQINWRDSVVISDTIRLIETGKGNIEIFGGKQHVTFYIDLDSIRVMIRNDSIVDIWQRPAKQ